MNVNKKSTFFYEILLKLGIVFFMFGIAYHIFMSSSEVENFVTLSKILTIVSFLGLSLFSIALPRQFFKIFVFFLIFIVSIFKIIIILSKEVIDIEIISVYFLLITMSLFLLTKVSSHTHRS